MARELTQKKMYAVFVPAILLCMLALFIQIVRYEPLYPKETKSEDSENTSAAFVIPILPTDPIIGSKKSPITVIAFEDFSCGACKVQYELFLELQKNYPDKVKMIWKGLPVNDFPYPSVDAIRYGFCANEQKKFSDFASYAYANHTTLSQSTLTSIATEVKLDTKDLESCLSSDLPNRQVDLNKNIAEKLNIQSVPTFFIDNVQIKTPSTLEEWKQTLKL